MILIQEFFVKIDFPIINSLTSFFGDEVIGTKRKIENIKIKLSFKGFIEDESTGYFGRA